MPDVEDGDAGDTHDGAEPDAVTEGPDWVKLNKQFKTKSGAWAVSHPRARLVLMGMSTRVADRVMQPLLDMSGTAWELRQRQKTAKGGLVSSGPR